MCPNRIRYSDEKSKNIRDFVFFVTGFRKEDGYCKWLLYIICAFNISGAWDNVPQKQELRVIKGIYTV
jgi:hypothetical protein